MEVVDESNDRSPMGSAIREKAEGKFSRALIPQEREKDRELRELKERISPFIPDHMQSEGKDFNSKNMANIGTEPSSLPALASKLVQAAKDCDLLWRDNKNLQGQFINDLSELQNMQAAVNKNGMNMSGMTIDAHNVTYSRQTLERMQQQASQLYQQLLDKRQALLAKLTEGLQQVALLQQNLIGVQLLEWKRKQKLEQIGAPFPNKDEQLNNIQTHFELLAEHNWQLRTYASWLLDLVRRMPQLPDNSAQQYITSLGPIIENLTKLLCMLISQSFIVSVQPEPVLKTLHKFVTEVRLLIGDKLGIKQQLDNANVTMKIIQEDQARQQMQDQSIKTGVGDITNNLEKLQIDEKGHMTAKFSNWKITRITRIKPTNKGPTAVDQKYGLLFHVSPFQLGNLGTFDVWTLSLPIMVTVHGSQDCDAQANILWHRAFGDVNWAAGVNEMNILWPQLAEVLGWKFRLFTGVHRPLDQTHLAYLSQKLCGVVIDEQNAHMHPINFQKFAKTQLQPNEFPFWDWFFNAMHLIKSKLQVYWDEGWCIGFVSKQEAMQLLEESSEGSFLLRFSDSTLGGVSISFVTLDKDHHKLVIEHMVPFVVRQLDQLSLAQRIDTCNQLQHIQCLHKNIDKDTLLQRFKNEEHHKSPTSASDTSGYTAAPKVIMVVNLKNSSSVRGHGDSPVPSPQSPSEPVNNMTAMDTGDNSTPEAAGPLDDSFGSLTDIFGQNVSFLQHTPQVLPQLDLNILHQTVAPYGIMSNMVTTPSTSMEGLIPRPPPPYSNS